MKEKGKKLELPISLSPHKLRHSCATEMVSRGGDLRVVQEILGHSSLSVTQIYLHVDVNYLKKEYLKSHPLENVNDKE
jgi:site-specific recombinase XerD